MDFGTVKALTAFMADQISEGTLDAPSWDVINTAKVATSIYAPLGTNMSLGDHVRVVRAFVEGFKKTGKGWNQGHQKSRSWTELDADASFLGVDTREDVIVRANGERTREDVERHDHIVDLLAQDLKVFDLRLDTGGTLYDSVQEYHNKLLQLGIKDDRIRVGPLARRVLVARIVARTLWLAVLTIVSLPGLFLWTPVFAATRWSVTRFKRTGPPEDVWDEIAQHKLLVGLLSGTCVWLGCVLVTLPIAPVTFFFVPCLMWLSLRFLEDAVSAFRALTALTNLIWIGKRTLLELYKRRQQLHGRVLTLAVESLELPDNPEKYFRERGGREKGRVRGSWESNTGYFSIRRRRKRDVSPKLISGSVSLMIY